MGWNYILRAKSGYDLFDYDVFDREGLARFMQLTKDEYDTMHKVGRVEVNIKHIDNAIAFLTDFNERIRKMPCDEDGGNTFKNVREETDEQGKKRIVRDEKGEYVYDYFGTEKNIAIFKEVDKVLCREYHFNYPWQKDRVNGNGFGVTYMIEALEKAKRHLRDLHVETAWLYYE